MKMAENKTAIAAHGETLHDGDMVYTHDYNNDGKVVRFYGTLYVNEDNPEVSDWCIAYDDGNECAVLEMNLVFKA
jgi:hypothetical protein